ncbi:hypothetical protein MHC_04775 [Mycoplasma haemocanis str. Illinois]|uniref:Uncharacterized protein n=1 Tax=Mycoplasma haemocanis (strain Illinois) TaxID=1111676 RepID=H6N839_MYCHN|nr:hypothetical protein [Mycoplasma haemocanis]AEW45811.1 hypothetical protein MHC_04775 [Mycoplasma haemocanis str. Illinois]
MAISKLVKVGGPTLTGIGGVIATSSLISQSAEEKLEERIKTKALTDEEPPIKDYKDANESDQQGDSQGEGGTQGSESNDNPSQGGSKDGNNQSSDKGGEGEDSKSGESSSSTEAEIGDSDGEEAQDSPQGSKDTGEETGDDSTTNNSGVSSDGSVDAEYNNVSGTKYGTKDMRMTRQELEKTMQMKSGLESFLEQLRNI